MKTDMLPKISNKAYVVWLTIKFILLYIYTMSHSYVNLQCLFIML